MDFAVTGIARRDDCCMSVESVRAFFALDNKKFKAAFGAKPRLLDAEEVADITGHPVGGVCPFGLATPLPVYCDQSLRDLGEVVPAAGAANAAVRIAALRLADLVGAQWVDVCQQR
jgi:prolyl-tRNA editing enzyme YbaK/EbsC (Cys-tRNA(Pro) deacylase)